MIQRRAPGLGSERGATLVLVALSLVVLLGMGALAVDLAAAYSWRAEAQKIADSAALAGGSAFLDFAKDDAPDPARARAYEYALRHTIKGEGVDSAEVQVAVITDSMKVRVRVGREGMPTWFARVLGIDDVDIAAVAAAQAVAAGASRCLKPIALPDLWEDRDDDTNGNRLWDNGEDWQWDPSGDNGDDYRPLDPDVPIESQPDATSYGGDWRSDVPRDYGRDIQIKSADPNDPYNYSPGVFYPWRLPLDDDQGECQTGGGGNNDPGAATYRRNICSCNNSKIVLGQPYEIQTGNMVGPTYQGFSELYDSDRGVTWGTTSDGSFTGPVRTVTRDDGTTENVPAMDSPRVMKIALFSPDVLDGSGMQEIVFNNFALLFLEDDQQGPQDEVSARFLRYVSGEEDDGATDGVLVRYLRLVE